MFCCSRLVKPSWAAKRMPGNSQTQGFSGLSARLNLFQQKLVLPTEGFCMFFQKLPLFRQLDALGPPDRKGNAQFCFQTVDKAADPCWLMYNLLPAWDRLSQVQICKEADKFTQFHNYHRVHDSTAAPCR